MGSVGMVRWIAEWRDMVRVAWRRGDAGRTVSIGAWAHRVWWNLLRGWADRGLWNIEFFSSITQPPAWSATAWRIINNPPAPSVLHKLFETPPYSGDCFEFRFRSGSNTRALSSAAGVFKKMQMVTSTTITFALVLSKPNVAELEKHDYNLSRPLLTQRCAWVWEVILRLAGQWWISSCVEGYSTAAMHAHILGDHHKGLHFTSSKSLAIANRQYFYANYQHNLHSTILLIMCFQAHYNWQASFSSRLRCSTEYEY